MKNCQTGVLPFLDTQDMKRGSNFSCISNLWVLKRPNCLNFWVWSQRTVHAVRHVFHTLSSWIISNLHCCLKNKCALPGHVCKKTMAYIYRNRITVYATKCCGSFSSLYPCCFSIAPDICNLKHFKHPPVNDTQHGTPKLHRDPWTRKYLTFIQV